MSDYEKPCPFCGSTNLKSGGDDKIVGTWCLDCEATGPNHYGRYEWNDRADRIEELEAENKNLRYMIIDQIEGAGDDPEIMAASRAEWAARAKASEAYAEEIYAHAKELEAKLRDVEWRFEHLEKYGDTKDTREFATEALAILTGGKDG